MQEVQKSRAPDAANAALRGDGALLGSAVVVVWNDVAHEGRDQFYDWHDKEHMPERLAIPGFRRGRRYIKPGHSPEWLTLYEAADLSVLVSREYLQRLNAPTTLTVDTLKHFRNTSRAVCRVVDSVGSSSGGYMLTLRLAVPASGVQAFHELLSNRVFPRIIGFTGVVACHLCAADAQASYTDTAESRTRQFDVPAWVVMVEATRPEAAEQARELIERSGVAQLGATVRNDGSVYSLEICQLSRAYEDR
jgi:hypothetical protein